MRAKSLIVIAVIQVAAALGTSFLPAQPAQGTKPQPTAVQTICARVQDPSTTALRLVVEQGQLRRAMPGVPWTLLLALLTVPCNIVVWQALWRVLAGDGLSSSESEDWSSRTLQRTMVIPQTGSVNGSWTFPSSMTTHRR
ncbi:hypothetical protein SAMN05421819_1535 [Bryocella elongata]|uniref:Uncharacterized protein n=1 Tax=Bryocella elongata TaxID=863522 RepID=A0A1H5WDL3_9BACT|nr:hypothetical protein [Bryocella elongata]SEF97552.1 hypothetical protein SAMN05421819_1535 [Bryocella elongata]